MPQNAENLAWIDLEMTGLQVQTCVIIEIASLVTDKNLNLIAEGPVIAIHQPQEALDAMDEWNTKHHGESGLVKRVQESKLSTQDAEEATLQFLSQYIPAGVSPLCGNSIHQDKLFLSSYMKRLMGFFHYRLIDVSTVKELVRRWYPQLPEFPKQKAHEALKDIHESVGELKYYRQNVFKG
jgi:oligoribonuclease